MGQVEVYELLKQRRLAGDESFFTARDVEKRLAAQGHTNGVLKGVKGDLMRLTISKYLETRQARNIMEWPGRFRIKRKYCNRNGKGVN